MTQIKAITRQNAKEFRERINPLLDEGYRIISSNCFFDHLTGPVYQAILLKEESISTRDESFRYFTGEIK